MSRKVSRFKQIWIKKWKYLSERDIIKITLKIKKWDEKLHPGTYILGKTAITQWQRKVREANEEGRDHCQRANKVRWTAEDLYRKHWKPKDYGTRL